MSKNDPIITYGCFHPDYIEEKKYFEECKVYAVQIESNLACRVSTVMQPLEMRQ
ncbi:MAG: hypothetical protein O8C60_00040 [Candidatus Methanoperedens sp.]|nr:hypothetical protein [Candidatus Methanoperedens sp.]